MMNGWHENKRTGKMFVKIPQRYGIWWDVVPSSVPLVDCYCGHSPVIRKQRNTDTKHSDSKHVFRIDCPCCNYWDTETKPSIEGLALQWNKKIDWRTLEANCVYTYDEYKELCESVGGELIETDYGKKKLGKQCA